MKYALKMAAMVMMGCCAMGAQAQMGASSAGGAMVAPAKSFDSGLSGLEKEFVSLAKAMPADKYDFAPSQAIFKPEQKTEYAGVRSFGAMVVHVAQANYNYGGAVGAMKPDVDVKGLSNLKSKDEIVEALEKSFAFVHKAVGTLTPENAFQSVRGDATRASLAGAVVAHGFDHYGQLVEYARMNGIVPPASQK